MNLALIGYGRMGKEVEHVARERGLKIAQVFDSKSNIAGVGITPESLKHVDVCVDFSKPEVVLENIEAVARCGRNIVVGTTGWYEKLEQVKQCVSKHRIGFLYASNFSLGMNLFSHMMIDAARLIDKYPEYDVAVRETHHAAKADSPSGTALALGSQLLHTIRRKQELLTGSAHGRIRPDQLQVTSSRVGHVMGRHEVMFDSESDTIELIHTAKSRKGFALGAVIAAEWLRGKKGFYTMRDVLVP